MGAWFQVNPGGGVNQSKISIKKISTMVSFCNKPENVIFPLDKFDKQPEVNKVMIPVLPANFKQVGFNIVNFANDTIIDKFNIVQFAKNKVKNNLSDEKQVKFSVYAQDPLVTPELQLYSIKSIVDEGPVNNRFVTSGRCYIAQPDDKGNFIIDPKKPQFDRINAFVFANKSLEIYEKALKRKIKWAFPEKELIIKIRARKEDNAYYDRDSASIEMDYFDKKGKRFYTSRSADLVAHECGHAILDALKPGYLVKWGASVDGIHEGVADCTSIMVALESDYVIDKLISQTKGNLRKDNLVCMIAEQFARMSIRRKCLRNANNNVTLTDYKTGKIEPEGHDLSLLLSGAFYDIFVEMTDRYKKEMSLKDAIIKSRDDITQIFIRAVGDFAPPGNIYYDDIAKAILKADLIDMSGKYQQIIKRVFRDRKVITPAEYIEWYEKQLELPELNISNIKLNSKASIEKYINDIKSQLGINNKHKYKLESAYDNKYGEKFFHLVAPNKVNIKYRNQEFSIEVTEGLTLAFDKKGTLFYLNKNDISALDETEASEDVIEHLEKFNQKEKEGKILKRPPFYRVNLNSNMLVKAPLI